MNLTNKVATGKFLKKYLLMTHSHRNKNRVIDLLSPLAIAGGSAESARYSVKIRMWWAWKSLVRRGGLRRSIGKGIRGCEYSRFFMISLFFTASKFNPLPPISR